MNPPPQPGVLPALEFRDVTFSHPGAAQPVLDRVSWRLEPGRLVALQGDNGSGKSTLALLAAGLLHPDSGEVVIPAEARRRNWSGVGLVFQNPDDQLLGADAARELAWGLENLGVPPEVIRERVEAGLERFGLKEFRDTPPEMLSDGMKQLTAVAAVAVMEPAFIILDEATVYLDPFWSRRLQDIAAELKRTAGVLWIATEVGRPERFHEVWTLEGGKILRCDR